jgi:hypothetical protein
VKLYNLHTLLQNTILTSEPLIHPHLASPPKGTIEDRVAIYADGFYLRLEETLHSDYEILASILGGNKFTKMCIQYIDCYPSQSYTLNFFGQHLEAFLKKTQPYNKKPYLSEIASFEWAQSQSITTNDTDLLSVNDLQSVPVNEWPENRFYLHPSSTILTMHWNSLELIEAVRKNNPIPFAKKLKAPQHVLVWRRQRETRYCKLKYLDYILMKAILSKATFLEICEQLSQKMPEEKVPTYLVKELHAWLQEQLLTKDLN